MLLYSYFAGTDKSTPKVFPVKKYMQNMCPIVQGVDRF